MLDRYVSDKNWNEYLLKYKTIYAVKPDEIGIRQIKTVKYGGNEEIQLYSYEKKLLCALFNFKNAKGLNVLLAKLPKYCTVTQEGQSECIIVFPEDKLQELDKMGIIHPRHRKTCNLTPEQRKDIGLRFKSTRTGVAGR